MNVPTADALGFAALPEPDRARIETELAPGERLFWAAQAGSRPTAALSSPAKPGAICLISLGALIALTFVGARQAGSGQPVDPGAFVLMGLAMGIAALISGFVTMSAWSDRRWNRRPDHRQLYALTDRRVVIWEPADRAGGVEVLTIEPDATAAVHRLEYPDGSGEIRISFVAENNEAAIWPPRSLVGIGDVHRVESSIRAVLIGRSVFHHPVGRPTFSRPQAPVNRDDFEEPF